MERNDRARQTGFHKQKPTPYGVKNKNDNRIVTQPCRIGHRMITSERMPTVYETGTETHHYQQHVARLEIRVRASG
jgi:hypothetical protein